MSALFSPVSLGGLSFANRVAVPPMCQYAATDGTATDWHIQHWMNLAISGAAMVTMEATGVERQGRITHGCLGLYSDDNEDAAKQILVSARRVAPPGTRFGIQLAHAGRKASTHFPWHGGGPLGHHDDPWQTVAPSAIPYAESWHVPRALDEAGILRIVAAFASAAERAVRAGFDYVELHLAHGYLIHEFLSPFSNQRSDHWGGSLENRMRLALAVTRAVRAALPAEIPVGCRMSVTEWMPGGFDVEEAVIVARALGEEGIAFICCSSGGNHHAQKIPTTPGYQVPFADRIRREAGVPTRAVGLIHDPAMAEAIVADGRADMVALGRAILADPRWPWRAAARFDAPMHHVPQYARAVPMVLKGAAPAKPAPTA